MLKKGRPASALAIALLVVYVFWFQLDYPFGVRYLLYIDIIAFVAAIIFCRYVTITREQKLFMMILGVSIFGILYTNNRGEAVRYTLVQMSALIVMVAITNIRGFQKKTIHVFLGMSFVSMLGAFLQFLFPEIFLSIMSRVLRSDCYAQLTHSYYTDHAFAGWTTYTGYIAFYASVLIGALGFRLVLNKKRNICYKAIDMLVIFCSLFCVILTSKRGIMVALVVAIGITSLIWMKEYNGFSVKLLLAMIVAILFVLLLAGSNDYIARVIARFTSNKEFFSDRDVMSINLLNKIFQGNILMGYGTSSVYSIYGAGAHNIYLQILYENGLIGLGVYALFFGSCIRGAYKNKSLISLFVQILFLVYGLVGNPLYSSNLLIYYIVFLVSGVNIDRYIIGGEILFHEDRNIDISQRY